MIDWRKLIDYALAPDHDDGGSDKARVFASALGMTASDAPALAKLLLAEARDGTAVSAGQTIHGQLYRIDFAVRFKGRSARLRSGWIVPPDGSPTRLTTVFVLRSGHETA